MVNLLARRWWLITLRGVAAIIFGLLAIALPRITLATLILLFGAYAFADGIFAVIHAIGGGDESESRWLLLLEGLLGIGVGLITFFEPGLTAIAMLFYIAAWSLATGVLEIAAALRLRKQVTGEFWLLLGGLCSIVFAIIVMVHPGAGALALVWLIGAYALLFGIFLLALGLRLRGLKTALLV
ncbi:MAG TPA: HdeD family acid-resistance protein [Candidatus Binataceae bacterium]